MVARNVYRLAQPEVWVQRWQWLSHFNPGVLLSGQWRILTTDPQGWIALVLGWAAVLAVLAVLFFLSIVAFDFLLSAIKLRKGNAFNFAATVMEIKHHLWPLTLSTLLVYIVSNILLLAFSIPVTMATVMHPGSTQTVIFVLAFGLLFLASVFLSAMAMYTWLAIVFHDYGLKPALIYAWRFLRTHWISTLLLMIIQTVVVVLTMLVLLVAISLVLIPIVIATYLLVAYKQFDLTQYVPQLVFYGLVLIFTLFSSIYTVFQLANWSLLFQRPNESDDADMMA